MSGGRVEDPGIARVAGGEGPVGQHLHQAAVGQRLARGEIRQAGNAQVLQGRIQSHVGVVGGIAAMYLHGHPLPALTELPAGIRCVLAQEDAVVLFQIMRLVGRAVSLQVLGAGAQQVFDPQKRTSHQAW